MSTQKRYVPKLFWDEKARRSGLDFEAAVCCDDPSDNEIIDRIQRKLMRSAFQQIGQRIDLAGKKILDYGCGTGRWVEFFRSYGMEYTGVDLSTEMVRIAAERFSDANFAALSADGIQYPSRTFDVVCSIAVIHHNPYKEQSSILQELSRIIKFKGFLVIFESISSPDSENILEFPRSVADWNTSLNDLGLKQLWIERTCYFSTRTIMNKLVGKNRFRPLSNKIGIFLDPYIGSFLPTRLQTRGTIVFQKTVEK
jgi:ubiquinone/menaquinone biosynthesis C-methylase UbiE